jgi:hypothetical protein
MRYVAVKNPEVVIMKFLCGIQLFAVILLAAHHAYAAQQDLKMVYTKISECQETVENENAAFSELMCKSIGGKEVRINQVGADYFGISLAQGAQKISTDFSAFPAAMPEGKVIEWHSRAGVPLFMVFRISYEDGALHKEVLTVNRVTDKSICTIAAVDVKKTPNANQKVRDLIRVKLSDPPQCPAAIIRL